MLNDASAAVDGYDEAKDEDKVTEDPGFRPEASQMLFKAGQSKRIWGELYKVGTIHIHVKGRILHYTMYSKCVR